MKCECMDKMKEKLKDMILNSEEFANKDNLKVEINNKNIGIDYDTENRVLRLNPFLIFEYETEYKENKKTITKKEDVNILISYCPFCGVEYNK